MRAKPINTNNAQSRTNRFLNGGIPLCILCSYIWLATRADLRVAIPEMLGITALVSSLLIVALGLGQRGQLRWTPFTILLVALLCRIPFLVRPPELSDDLFRYLWDGLQLLHGHNPYTLSPSASLTAGSDLLQRINHPQLVTIYPPMAQWLFAGGALWGGGIFGLKLFLGLIDLVTCGLILLLLRRLEKPAWLAVLYAWQPLPILEIAGSGHIDGAAIALFLAALWLLLLLPGRTLGALLSGGCFSAAVLVKLFPLVFFPAVWLLLSRRQRGPFILTGVGTALLLSWPFWPDLAHGWETLHLYVTSWEFSGFLYRLLHLAGISGHLARLQLGCLFMICLWLIFFRHLQNHPLSTRDAADSALRGGYGTALCFLLLTTTLHPWYALYLAMFLPFVTGVSGLILSWSVLLAYRVLIPYTLLGLWQESTLWSGVIWISPLLAAGLTRMISRPWQPKKP